MKKQITQTEFNKRVEMEAEQLHYFDRIPKDVAYKKAREVISEEYEVKERDY